jgi:sigma-B regulation protein RsbU (phosphoserine phosphatase)
VTAGSLPGERELEELRLIAADYQKVGQELALAGEIQVSFLPDALPDVPGWQLTATLEPARETSGDFYDFIPLPNGRLGILVADVTDKGMGAALYMALSRTLVRTYAAEYDTKPELTLSAVNRRILVDTHTDLFVTVFYGILDPISGTLTYCNAGHNPPYLLDGPNRDLVQELVRTGIPLGIFDDVTWQQGTTQIGPGDVLILYTDGVTEAQDRKEIFFGEKRLLETAQANLGRSAQDIQEALIKGVHEFTGDVPQFDDITLMVLVRDSEQ